MTVNCNKTELAAVERKIQRSIAPEPKDELVVQVEKQKEATTVSESIVQTKCIYLFATWCIVGGIGSRN